MRNPLFALALLVLVAGAEAREGSATELPWHPKTGDVVFHTSRSAQSEAVQQATRSRWSHVGMVVPTDGGWGVVEAVQPVRVVPLPGWLQRGEGGHYAVYRLKDPTPLTEQAEADLTEQALRFLGKDYDPFFGWSDDRIYCSELVWKAYDRALRLDLGTPHPVTDFDLDAPAVGPILKKRFPEGLPEGEVAVSPQDLADSPLLARLVER